MRPTPSRRASTDSAGNTYVEVAHFVGADGTEESVWTAPITLGAGTRPTVTARATGAADMALATLEYSGLSLVNDASVVDQQAHAIGTTVAAASVASGATTPTGAPNELALGLYADSGFSNALTAGSGYSVRSSVFPTGDMELLAEDRIVATGSNPSAAVGTGKATPWLIASIVFKTSSGVAGRRRRRRPPRAWAPPRATGVQPFPGPRRRTVAARSAAMW